MTSWKERVKRLYWRLRGKNSEAVVVTFATGEPELVARVFAEIQRLVPGRRHLLIEAGAGYRELRQRLRPYRIGLAPVLFTGEPQYRALRRAAFLLAPTRILAYNRRLERHHLRLGTVLSSWLFLRGVALDRIFLRPKWLCPWKRDKSVFPTAYLDLTGREFTPGRKRVAVISPYFPYPLSHGGAVRIFNLTRELAVNFDVVLFAFQDQETEQDFAPVLEYCARVILVPKTRYREPSWATFAPGEVHEFQSPTMRHLVQRFRSELAIDRVQVEYTALAPYRGDILVAHDLTFDLHRQIWQRERTLSAWWNYWRWRRFEQRWLRRYPRVVVMSKDDRKLLSTTLHLSNVEVIPNGVDLARFTPEIERPGSRILFVGSFRHFPNVVAYRFFVEQVWPELKHRVSDIRLTAVAGPDPLLYWGEHTGLLELPGGAGIELYGFVQDLRPMYVESNVVIVPTLVSAGTNLKVLEALAMDRAVVSTSSGCAGLGLEHGMNVLIADSPGNFAQAIITLLADREYRQAIAAAGRRHAEEHFGWRQIGVAQRRLIRSSLGGRIDIRPAGAADVEQIWAIQSSSPEASQWLQEDYLAFDCCVISVDGAIAGFLVSRPLAHKEREILNVAIHPEFRRLGLARRLITSEIERFPGEHFLEVRQSNTPARTLYQNLGFREVGVRPGYYDNPPETGIVMRFLS